MSEIHNPDFDSRPAGGTGGVRSLLVLLVLASMLFFGFQYLHLTKLSAAIAHSPVPPYLPQQQIGPSMGTPGNFGWLTFIAKPLYLGLRLLHDHWIGNWGWSIIVLTVIFNLLIIWPRMMSMRSSLKMMRVQPKVDALKKRYAHLQIDDPRRAEMNVEMMALYKAEGANMFGGCLPLLLQMPLLFAYMSVLRNAAELHQAHWLWLPDLSMPDPLHILPFLIIGSMVLTQCITAAPGMSPPQRRMFALLMPMVMGFSLWHCASGLSLYWVTCNFTNLLVQVAINRSALGKEMQTLAAKRG